jgi:hypothetical protein
MPMETGHKRSHILVDLVKDKTKKVRGLRFGPKFEVIGTESVGIFKVLCELKKVEDV